jgi:hypothetical protein
MKKALTLLVIAAGLALTGSFCEESPSEGGDLFDMGSYDTTVASWDMTFMLPGPLFERSILQSAATMAVPPAEAEQEDGLPSMYLYHAPVVINTGYEYEAAVPELHMLLYALLPEGEISPIVPGDSVKVRFLYQADADALDGDFFEARVFDGATLHIPVTLNSYAVGANLPPLLQARGQTVEVNYSYTATSNSLGLMFMVGLSNPGPPLASTAADQFFLDDLSVTVNGAPLVVDQFEGPAPLGLALAPRDPVGTFGNQAEVVLSGAQSLRVTGGRFFTLTGQGGTFDGYSGAILSFSDATTYNDGDPMNPYWAETQAGFSYNILMGDYRSWEYPYPTAPYCSEFAAMPTSYPPLSGAMMGEYLFSPASLMPP